ncbi:hypothetical protein [Lentzea indica]|uniref:hypothetical protein n=1 Tax=Lentzea indica TaxID=2604800 RepID=UPI0035E42B44
MLETGQGFTVSARVRLTDDTVNRTVVSQEGSVESAFRLGYDAAVNPSKWWRAKANAVANKWIHLVATYNASAHTQADGRLSGQRRHAEGRHRLRGRLELHRCAVDRSRQHG